MALSALLSSFQGGYSLQGVKKIGSFGDNKDTHRRNEKLCVSVKQPWEHKKMQSKKKIVERRKEEPCRHAQKAKYCLDYTGTEKHIVS